MTESPPLSKPRPSSSEPAATANGARDVGFEESSSAGADVFQSTKAFLLVARAADRVRKLSLLPTSASGGLPGCSQRSRRTAPENSFARDLEDVIVRERKMNAPICFQNRDEN